MGKIIFSILFCVVPMIANATDMCARDNVTVLAFDPQVGCVSIGNNKAELSWWAQRYKHPAPTDCANNCYLYCNDTWGGASFCGSADYRKELFDSIGT